MTKVSIKGYVSDGVQKELILTDKQTTVERSITKTLISVDYPPELQTGGEVSFDIGFTKSNIKISTSLVNTITDTTGVTYTPAEAYSALEYMSVMDLENKTVYYNGQEYTVLIENFDSAQVAGRGNEITVRLNCKVGSRI